MQTSLEQPVQSFDVDAIRAAEFPITREWRFFNHAACSPLPGCAALAVARQAREQSLMGNLGNTTWHESREAARTAAAKMIRADPDEIAFLGNTADGLGIVANGLRWQAGDNIVTTNVEYPANMYPWMRLARLDVRVKAVSEVAGRIPIEALAGAMDERTRVLAISWVEFASGFMNDVHAIGRLCRDRDVLFVLDAIQALGAFPIDVAAAHIDVLASGGQKWLLGPRGCAIFYCSRRALPLIDVSTVGAYSVVDEHDYLNYNLTFKPNSRRFEHGTENAAGICGLRASLELLGRIGADVVSQRVLMLTEYFCEGIRDRGYSVMSPRGAGEASGIVLFWREGMDAKRMAQRLEEQRFVVSARGGRLRFAPHFYNTHEEVDALLGAL